MELLIDPITLLNLILCIVIVILSIIGYVKIRSATPLFIGTAFFLFGISHAATLLGLKTALDLELIVVRTFGYIAICIGLFLIIRDIMLRMRTADELKTVREGLEHRVEERVEEITWANEALRESEEKYRTVFENTGTATVVVEESNIISLANAEFAKLSGFSKDDIEGKKSWTEFVVKEDLDRMLAQHRLRRQNREKALTHYEFQFVTKSGDIRAVYLSIDVIPGTRKSVASLLDITERKRAEEMLKKREEDLEAAYEEIAATKEELWQNYDELSKKEQALRGSERKYRDLVELLPQTVFELDEQGIVTTANSIALKSFGYSKEDLENGLNAFDVIAPEDRDRARENVQRVLNGEIPGGIEYTALRKDGSTFPVIIYTDAIIRENKPAGVRGVLLIDITERKRAEEALRAAYENAKELSFIVNHSPAVAWLWKAEPGWPVEYVSDNIGSFGYTPDEFTGGRIAYASIIFEDDLPRISAEVERYTQEGRSEFSQEYRIVTKSGDIRWVYDWTWVRRDEDGTVTHYQGITLDNTDRKLAEEWLKKFSEELEAKVAERTEALNKSLHEKEILLKEIHHRVKNNLQIVASLLNLQSRQITDPATLAMIRESQNRIKAMALVHERLYRSEDISSIDVSDYVRFMGTNLFNFYGVTPATVRLTVDISDIRVDINRAIPLGLIINELLSNSLKYAFPSGRKGTIAVTGKKDDGTIRIIVQDDGAGIPESLDWKKTESLGLRLVNSLTEQLQGTIELDRTVGTKFTIVVKEKG
ncbi:MAG: PAS domain S-box protein [Methanoregula sp.]|nr:MAG: PAS domain S-box protein [Methanoregula sp.]